MYTCDNGHQGQYRAWYKRTPHEIYLLIWAINYQENEKYILILREKCYSYCKVLKCNTIFGRATSETKSVGNYYWSEKPQAELSKRSKIWIFSEILVSFILFLNLALYQNHLEVNFLLKYTQRTDSKAIPHTCSLPSESRSPIEGSKEIYYFKICTDDFKVTGKQIDIWGSLIQLAYL